NMTLSRYFASRFVVATLAVFGGMFLLVVLVDYIELSRRVGSRVPVSAFSVALTSFYRVPYVFEILMPFCVLVGAMTSFLTLSRRMELVVARAAGISAWQFTFPALACALVMGLLATTVYNPASTYMQARSIVMEAGLFGLNPDAQQAAKGIWLNQVT